MHIYINIYRYYFVKTILCVIAHNYRYLFYDTCIYIYICNDPSLPISARPGEVGTHQKWTMICQVRDSFIWIRFQTTTDLYVVTSCYTRWFVNLIWKPCDPAYSANISPSTLMTWGLFHHPWRWCGWRFGWWTSNEGCWHLVRAGFPKLFLDKVGDASVQKGQVAEESMLAGWGLGQSPHS